MALSAILFLNSCEKAERNSDDEIVLDGLGREVAISADIERIFGLSPALTEMLFFICPDSLIVARTQACDYPLEAMDKPEVSTYPFDIESIIKVRPDLVLSEEGITSPEQLDILRQNNINVYVFRYRELEDVFSAMKLTGQFCDCEQRAINKIDSLREILSDITESEKSGKKALGLIWNDPIYVYGRNTLFTDMLEQIGMENAIDSVFHRPYPEISREYLLKINPDFIYGPDFRHLDTTLFSRFPELKRIRAYKDSAVYFVDGDLLTRPGPRIFKALKEMKEVQK